MVCCSYILTHSYEPDEETIDNLIEYVWQIDIDEGTFGMGNYACQDIYIKWSWKSLYQLRSRAFKKEAHFRDTHIDPIVSDYQKEYAAVIIQCYVRRYLMDYRALLPPCGKRYLRAKRIFEQHQQDVQSKKSR